MLRTGLVSFVFCVVTSLMFSGCVDQFKAKLQKIYEEKLAPLMGLEPSKKEEPIREPTLEQRQVRSEFIKELYRAALLREATKEEFTRQLNALDQGAHLEGVYNGLIYSQEFKIRETGSAPTAAVKLFAEIMTELLSDQAQDPLKTQSPQETDAGPPFDKQGTFVKLEAEALTQSLFTLKRRLGEEVLKTIDFKKEYREKLATWYGRLTAHLNQQGVDFGLSQRNKPEEYFHYKWALEAEEDRLKWECLNRVHLLMNSFK